MRILIAAAYISDENVPEFNNPLTGAGYIIKDIANHLGKGNEVFLLTRQLIKQGELNNIHLVQHQILDTIKHIGWRHIRTATRAFVRSGGSFNNRLKNAYFFLHGGYIEYVIKQLGPNIVNIHGSAYLEMPYILACIHLGVPYMITLHGLVGLSPDVPIDAYWGRMEGKLFRFYDQFRQIISIVSTGAKNDAIEAYKLYDGSNIHVISNPTTNHVENDETLDIRSKYSILEDSQIMICVGNVCARKNQLQLVRAYAQLNAMYAQKLYILFMGEDRMNGELQKCIEGLNLEEHVRYIGYVDHAMMPLIYKQAQFNALVSIDEGFGLSVIEGYANGIPSIVFEDIQAVEDFNFPQALAVVKERSDEALAVGIEFMMKTEWSSEKIRGAAKQFSFDKICSEYIDLYRQTKITEAGWQDVENLI